MSERKLIEIDTLTMNEREIGWSADMNGCTFEDEIARREAIVCRRYKYRIDEVARAALDGEGTKP